MDVDKKGLEEKILDKIEGRISLLQPLEVKERQLLSAFQEFCVSAGSEVSECEKKYFSDDQARKEFFSGFYSLGAIENLLNNPDVEDIIINGTSPVYVHHAKEGLKEIGPLFSSLDEVNLLIKKLLVFSGRKELKKINNIDLPGIRGRANIVYSPLGPELTITRIKSKPLSIIDLIGNETLNTEMAALLWLYIEGLGMWPGNILISGGPGSGKTTLLNALLSFIPADQHIVIIEDVMELITDWITNVSRLESDEDLSLAELVKNSLRMRPERILVGEVRGEEARDMATAMNIGKYCMATIHANTVREAILRLQNNPMNVEPHLVNLIDVIIVMDKIKSSGQVRRVIGEISETAGLEQKTILISSLWKFNLASGVLDKLSPTNVYRDRLSLASGISGKEVLEEIARRKEFLNLLVQKRINSSKEVSHYCDAYIHDKVLAMREVENYQG